MYQLNYTSESSLSLENKDIVEILEKAKIANSNKDISGCLIYHNCKFVQILEGKKEDVLQLYSKIQKDHRHHKVVLLWENEVEDRYFPEWNMAYCDPEEKNSKLYLDNLLLLSEISNRSSASILSFWATVRTILKQQNTL